MLRLFLATWVLAGLVWAKSPYHIAVCGVSRSAEELELALELSDSVLVKKCSDKKLDARIKMRPGYLEAYGAKELLLSQKRNLGVLSGREADKFIAALLQRLGTPKVESPKAELPKVESPQVEAPKIEEPVLETAISIPLPPEPEVLLGNFWRIESLASLDQWDYQVSTKVYPGVQLVTQFQLPEGWELRSRAAFGTSAFRVNDETVWNQQVFASLLTGKRFHILPGFSLMPQLGYLYWGSFSGLEDIPQFQRHDIEIGLELAYEFSEPHIAMSLAVSGLPVNLGLQNILSVRYHFVPNWFASAQGSVVAMWAHGPTSTFLSASLGIGLLL